MNIDQLNREYGLPGALQFIEGEGGIPFISINNSSANAIISLYGGQVLSFQPLGESEDLLFVSKKANYNKVKAIRGGIPVCWPWFGVNKEGLNRPNHGFARNSMWAVSKTEAINDLETRVKLELLQSSDHREIWPHSFKLYLDITVGNSLTLELVTRNTGQESFSITQALHAYFRVGDIKQVKISGLEGHEYLDKLDSGSQKKQSGAVIISEEVDRIYTDVKNQITIEDNRLNSQIQINSLGSNTAVVWNPWEMTAAKMSDLQAHDYQNFVCVETSNVAPDVIEISPGNEHRLRMNFKILKE